MFARATIVESSPDKLDQAIDIIERDVLPQARKLDGFQGFFGAVDRASGKVVTYTLWEDEEAMRTSEEAANRLRSEATEALAAGKPVVERYEVFLADVPSLTRA